MVQHQLLLLQLNLSKIAWLNLIFVDYHIHIIIFVYWIQEQQHVEVQVNVNMRREISH